MRPPIWRPPVEPGPDERTVMRLIKRAKLFVFLREQRHEIFDERFQLELAEIYDDVDLGRPRCRPRGSPLPSSCKPTLVVPTTRRSRRR